MVLSHEAKRARAMSPDFMDWLRIVVGSLLYVVVTLPCAALPLGALVLRPAAGVVAVSALLYGPAVGFGVGLVGDLLASLWLGSVWIHWSLGVAIYGLITGFLWLWSDIEAQASFGRRDAAKICFFVFAGSVIGMFLAGLIDILLGAAPEIAVLAWLPATLLQAVWGALLSITVLIVVKRRLVNVKALLARRAGRGERSDQARNRNN